MKNTFRILSCLLITIFSYSALAQTRITISQALDYWISNCEKEVVSAADAMPEAKYSYAPTAGEFTGARTFAEQIKHLAASNFSEHNTNVVTIGLFYLLKPMKAIRQRLEQLSLAFVGL